MMTDTDTITAANASRFDEAHYSEALTAYTVGWRDPSPLTQLLDFVAPVVPVGRRFEFKRADNAEAFYSESDDIRATGAAFKRVEYSGQTVDAKTLNKGLTIRVDHDEAIGHDWQERYVQLLLQRLMRNELRRAMAALDAAAADTPVTWDASGNPDRDLRGALIQAASDSGIRPNRILLGESAWDLRSSAYEGQETAGAIGSVALSPEALARKLFVEGVQVVAARYQSTETFKAALVGAVAYAFYAQEALSKDEPSNLKRFVTPAEDGRLFRVYVEESTKYTDLSVEHYSSVIATSDLGIQKLSVSAS
jgi:hypothetical protein